MNVMFRCLAMLPVGAKIGGLAALLLMFTALVGGISVLTMDRIGKENSILADQVVPVLDDVDAVTKVRLQQSVAMQTFLRFATPSEWNEERQASAVHAFDAAGARAKEFMGEVVGKVDSLVSSAGSDTDRQTWNGIAEGLQEVDSAHGAFESRVREIFDLAQASAFERMRSAVAEVEQLEAQLVEQVNVLRSALQQVADDTVSNVHAQEAAGLTLILMIAGVAILIGGLLATVIALGIVRPLKQAVRAIEALESGDKSRDLEVTGKDEVATLGRAYESLRRTLLEGERREEAHEAAQARAEEESRQKMLKLADRFEADVGAAVGGISSAIEELTASSNNMGAIAEENERQSAAVSAAAEQSSGNVQAVSAAAEELTTSITEISRQVSESTQVANTASEKADRADERIDGLTTSAEKIDSVVQLIQQIAEQTNLLALNATIEAARAGEAGKGFAVVAEEVKSLANQTASATEQVSEHISDVQAQTTATTGAIKDVNAAIKQINENATSISAAVEQQGTATQEIARNVQEASSGTREVTENIAGVKQAATETGSAASQVQGAANELSQQATALDAKVKTFLEEVRRDNAASSEPATVASTNRKTDDASSAVPAVAAE